jgi:hypothetical protein
MPWSNKWITTVVAFLLLTTMGLQMWSLAKTDSLTADEPIHVLSGLTVLQDHHILIDPEHPFLAKIISALPLLWLHPTIPYGASHLTPEQALPDYNTYREANIWGFDLFFTQGNNFNSLILASRAGMIILTLCLGLGIFFWTKNIFGQASGLVALALFTLDPSFLAHGHLANDDTAATLWLILSLAGFYRYLHRPTYQSIILTGLAFGLGLMTKFSLLAVGPMLCLILLAWWIYQQRVLKQDPRQTVSDQTSLPIFTSLPKIWHRQLLGLVAILTLGWAVIWVSYGTLHLLNPAQNPLSAPISTTQKLEISPATVNLAQHVLPFMYLKGAALISSPNRDAYIIGQCYTGSRWYYFPTLSLFKIPVAVILCFIVTICLWWKNRKPIGFAPIFIMIPLTIYLAISAISPLNIGFRHILPAYALVIILASWPASQMNWLTIVKHKKQWYLAGGFLALLSTLVFTDLLIFPNDLAYYNFLAQEPRKTPFIASDSNIDWGQGTIQLASYIKAHHIASVSFDNFISLKEAAARQIPLKPANPNNHAYKGYLALSRSAIVYHHCTRNNDWGWVVDHQQPIAIIGDAINLYKLE